MTIPVDHNKECWSAFCPTEEVAERELRRMTEKLIDKKLIISAKKELIGDAKHTFQGLMLYKFTIITAPKNK